MYNKINVFLYVKVEKGMYGIFQAGIISHMALKKNYHLFGYEPVSITLGLWFHNKNLITFTLVVNDFSPISINRLDDNPGD